MPILDPSTLPAPDTSRVTFKVTRFAPWPGKLNPTHWLITVQVRAKDDGHLVTFFNGRAPLADTAGKSQAEIVQWLWEQKETQDAAKLVQARLSGYTPPPPEPVTLPAGNVVGQEFVPIQTLAQSTPTPRTRASK